MSSNLQLLGNGCKGSNCTKQHIVNIDADLEKPRKTDHSPHPVEELDGLPHQPHHVTLCKGLATLLCCQSQLMNSGWYFLTFVPQEQ